MSEDERHRIIGKVVSDHEEAKRTLAALEAKAATMGETVLAVGGALKRQSTVRFDDHRLSMTITPAGSNAYTTHPFDLWPTIDTLKTLFNEITDTRTAIADLAQRRKDLGV